MDHQSLILIISYSGAPAAHTLCQSSAPAPAPPEAPAAPGPTSFPFFFSQAQQLSDGFPSPLFSCLSPPHPLLIPQVCYASTSVCQSHYAQSSCIRLTHLPLDPRKRRTDRMPGMTGSRIRNGSQRVPPVGYLGTIPCSTSQLARIPPNFVELLQSICSVSLRLKALPKRCSTSSVQGNQMGATIEKESGGVNKDESLLACS
ncbi:hypothetical protein HDV57DRAFT_481972 [Trichoderma longibrachiatum]